jgi:hypothetical protein
MILSRLRLFLALLVAVAVVETVAMVAVTLGDDEPAAPAAQLVVAAAVALVGSATVLTRARFLRRPWNTASDDAVVAGFVARWVVEVTLAFGAMNVGFVGALLTGAWWVGVLGLVFFLGPMPRLLPTEANVRRVEADLAARGTTVDLVAALARRAPTADSAPGGEA